MWSYETSPLLLLLQRWRLLLLLWLLLLKTRLLPLLHAPGRGGCCWRLLGVQGPLVEGGGGCRDPHTVSCRAQGQLYHRLRF